MQSKLLLFRKPASQVVHMVSMHISLLNKETTVNFSRFDDPMRVYTPKMHVFQTIFEPVVQNSLKMKQGIYSR